jgi:hypothetical protein
MPQSSRTSPPLLADRALTLLTPPRDRRWEAAGAYSPRRLDQANSVNVFGQGSEGELGFRAWNVLCGGEFRRC